MPSPSPPRRRRREADVFRGRVRAHDPFELIRWLAFSQPDPRKALAELVQNSLDAGAARIRVVRYRERGVPRLKIHDDGEGVIPELDRPDALRYIATHIGHSRKRSLSPQERFELMTQGQYGIGLLGFWSLGETLEVRSAVPGHRPHRLVLFRDKPDFVVEPLRFRLELEERWTEVIVAGLNQGTMSALRGGRGADYLGAELRGQLLARKVDLVVEDRMARSRRWKRIEVKPPRFLGERIPGLESVAVPGYPPLRMEIYLAGEEAQDHGLSVYSAGTLVAESFRELASLDLDREPWTDPRLSGFVDFPAFRVTPGSRRGIVEDDAARAFAGALAEVETVLAGLLDSYARRRNEEEDRSLVRNLQRALRDFYRQRPRYAMLPVQQPENALGGSEGEGASPGAEGSQAAGAEAESPEPGSPPEEEPDTHYLFPPGPLDAIRVHPPRLRIPCNASRTVQASGIDAAGRIVEEPVTFTWALDESLGSVTTENPESGRAKVVAGPAEAEGTLWITARSGDRDARAEVPVTVEEESPLGRGDEGIPEPEFVDQPGSSWRSRMLEGRWQVNTGHREYRAIADRPSLKLRYLAMLFAKEVVLESHQDPRLASPLEQLVEVASFADRKLSMKGRKRRGGKG